MIDMAPKVREETFIRQQADAVWHDIDRSITRTLKFAECLIYRAASCNARNSHEQFNNSNSENFCKKRENSGQRGAFLHALNKGVILLVYVDVFNSFSI